MTHVQLEKWMGLQERPWMEKMSSYKMTFKKYMLSCLVFWVEFCRWAYHFAANMLVHPDLVFQFVVVTF